MAQTMAFSTNHDRVYRDQAICAPYKQINGELVYLNFNKRSYRESGFASMYRVVRSSSLVRTIGWSPKHALRSSNLIRDDIGAVSV